MILAAVIVHLLRTVRRNTARLSAIERRVRSLGIVDTMIQQALSPPAAVVDMDEQRRRRNLKGLLLLPVGWLAHEVFRRPAVAAAAVGAATIATAGYVAWEPPEDERRATPEAVEQSRDHWPTMRRPTAQSPLAAKPDGARGPAPAPEPGADPSTETPVVEIPPEISPGGGVAIPVDNPGSDPGTVSPEPTTPTTTPRTTEPPVAPPAAEPDCALADLELLGIIDACL